jgi:methanesulfonate monooxygenase subunit beta
MSTLADNARALVQDTVYRATIALDDQKWDEFLALCADDFYYAIKSFSPEINRDMIYLQHDRKGLKSLLDLLPKHNTDHSPLRRHTVLYTVDVSPDGREAKAVSSFVVYQNMLDGANSHIDSGESRLFLVGKYYDTLTLENGMARFVTRDVRLDNRRLDKGSHWPI